VAAGASIASGVALLFVPGGAFIDMAIGVAMGVDAHDQAQVAGRAARTGLHVDDGLLSQGAATSAEIEGVVGVVLGLLGPAAAAFRVLRVARLVPDVARVAPAASLASQVRVARLLAANSRWLKEGGDILELEGAMLQAGNKLRFEEMRALRSVVYEAQRKALPAHSKESLVEFLRLVWSRRQELLSSPDREGAIYLLFSDATEPNRLTRPINTYLDSVVAIARGRRPDAVSNLQIRGDVGILEMARSASGFRGWIAEAHWYRFIRAGADPAAAVERIYLNVASDHATEIMGTVVRDIVDSESAFPGVLMAKLVPVRAAGQRSDAIVIYLKDVTATERVLAKIRGYHAARPELFMRSTPHMTERVVEGVSRAVNRPGGGTSFGEQRAYAVLEALERTTQMPNRSFQDFENEVTAEFVRMRINPERPHLDLPPSGR
jgi:hypothetical protein